MRTSRLPETNVLRVKGSLHSQREKMKKKWTRLIKSTSMISISYVHDKNQLKFLMNYIYFDYEIFVMQYLLSWHFITIEMVINPLRAKFFRRNINIYLHCVSFLHIDTTQVVEIPLQIRQEPTYATSSISWLLMSWRRKEPGHQQPWYWRS